MITEIYENLFKPNSDEEVASRRPTPKLKVGDRLRMIDDADWRGTDYRKGDTFTVASVTWDSLLEEWDYTFAWDKEPLVHMFLSDRTIGAMDEFEKVS